MDLVNSLAVRPLMILAAVTPAAIILVALAIRAGYPWRSEALWGAFLLGALVPFPLEPIYSIAVRPLLMVLPSTVIETVDTAILTPILEETGRFLVLWFIALRQVTSPRPEEAIAFGVSVALGFAGMENVLYAFDSSDPGTVLFVRMLTAIPSHCVDGLLMGAFGALAMYRPELRRVYLAFALIGPMTTHGVYNYWTILSEAEGGWAIDVLAGVVGLLAVAAAVIVPGFARRLIAHFVEDDGSIASSPRGLVSRFSAAAGWSLAASALILFSCLFAYTMAFGAPLDGEGAKPGAWRSWPMAAYPLLLSILMMSLAYRAARSKAGPRFTEPM